MLRSMYSGVSGMKGFQTKLDVIGNNIANVNTLGFKKSTINFQDLLSQNIAGSGVNPMQVGLGVQVSSINTIHNPGSAMATGVGTDLLIEGDGFFTVQDPNKDAPAGRFLTRAGNFIVDVEGNLTTTDGYSVLDDGGNPINIDPEFYESFRITQDGEVIGKLKPGIEPGEENPTLIGTLGITEVPNPAGLSKVGGSLFVMNERSGVVDEPSTAVETNSRIAAGMLEMSNVDLTEEFTEMIVAQRGFQANSRTITTSDEILQEVINMKR